MAGRGARRSAHDDEAARGATDGPPERRPDRARRWPGLGSGNGTDAPGDVGGGGAAAPRRARATGCLYGFHRGGEAVSYTGFNRKWRAACIEAGVEGKWSHDFRRTGYDRFMPELTLKEAMTMIGHRAVSTAMRYQHPETSRLRA